MSVLLAGAVFLSGCASVTRGVNEDVTIQATPANAKISTSTGHACTGSCVINVPRKKKFTVTASAPGYQTVIVEVNNRVGGQGTVALAGNALIGGVIGVGVDAASGATLDHYPNPVIIILKKGSGTQRIVPDRNIKKGTPVTDTPPKPAEPVS